MASTSKAPIPSFRNPKEHIREHILDTFGSTSKADHWLNRPNPLFEGRTPLEMLEVDDHAVEAELTRIDHGIYV